MKQTIRIFALALALMLFASCSAAKTYPTDDVYHPETDSAYFASSSSWFHSIVESGNGYYIRVAQTLLFADRETMEVMPLCSLPGCLHNEETDKAKRELCQAYFPTRSASKPMFIQDGALYVCHTKKLNNRVYILTKTSPDGTQRRDVLTFPAEEDILHFCVHRGRLYYITMSFGENGECRTILWEQSLDRPQEKPRELYRPKNYANRSAQSMILYGNRLYLLEPTDEKRFAVRIMDLRTREWTEIAPLEDYNSISKIWISRGKLMLNCCRITDETPAFFNDEFEYAIYRCELDGSNPEKTGLPWGEWCADEEYAYRLDPYTGDFRDSTLHILDGDFQELDEIPLADWPIEGGVLVDAGLITQNGGRQIVKIQEGEPHSMVFWYFDCSEIGSGKLQPKEFFRFIDRDYI